MQRLLSRKELSELLGIPEPSIATWASEGKGPRYSRVGRHVRYRVADVERWLDEQAQEKGAAR